MKTSFLFISVLVMSAAGGALADDGYGPYEPAIATSYTTETTVVAQQRASYEHRRALWHRVARDGGCNADSMPFEIASHCNRSAFGEPMGSTGGSE